MATDLEIINSALTKLGAGLITSDQKTNGSTKEARLAVERLPHVKKSILRSHPWNCAIRRTLGTPKFEVLTVSSTSIASSDFTWNGTDKWIHSNPSNYIIQADSGTARTFQYYVGGALKSSNLYYTDANETWEKSLESPPKKHWVSGSSQEAPNITYKTLDTTTNDRGDPVFGFTYRIPLPGSCLRLLSVDNDPDQDYRVDNGYINTDMSELDILFVSDVGYELLDPSLAEVLGWGLAHDMSYAITQSQQASSMTQQGYRLALAGAKTSDAQEDGRYYVESNLFDESRFGSSIFTDYRNHHRP